MGHQVRRAPQDHQVLSDDCSQVVGNESDQVHVELRPYLAGQKPFRSAIIVSVTHAKYVQRTLTHL